MNLLFENKHYLLILFLFSVAFLLGIYTILVCSNTGDFRIIFFDVGQGDGMMISSGRKQILIDGGSDSYILREQLSHFMPWGDSTIEMIIATHPDADHIGALAETFRYYDAGFVLDANVEKDTGVYRAWKSLQEEKRISSFHPRQGEKIIFPNGAVLEVLSPQKNGVYTGNDINDASIVTKLDFKEQTFLFTGDISSKKEVLLDVGEVDVLKVAHHGSKSSTSESFLDRTKPKDAIISSGKNNRYGHPTQEILARLRLYNVRVLRTDEMGNIIYTCFPEKDLCEVAREI
jgi:competence protein ComEC